MPKKLLQEKEFELEKIARQIARCKICQQGKVGLPVPGEGSADADIVFVGEAPGKQEAECGRPFVGRAGKLLRAALAEAGIDSSQVFITSPVKYLPVYVTPKPEDIAHGRVHLNAQLKIIQPKFVVVMGHVAALAVLGEKADLPSTHGTVLEKKGICFFISYHPAAPLYSPKLRQTFFEDIRKLKALINQV